MGSAQSSNIVDGMVAVMNDISNSSYINTSQKSAQTNIITGCFPNIDGDLNIKQKTAANLKLQQVIKLQNDVTTDSDIQQKMLQEASSTLGSAGLGYASANNVCNMYSEASATIRNTLQSQTEQTSTQSNIVDLSKNCEKRGHVGGNVNILQDNDIVNYMDNAINNSSVTSLTTKISQEVQQKATSKVEGLAGFLFGIAAIIFALSYLVASPISATGGVAGKAIMGIVVTILLGVLVYFVYLWINRPPIYRSVHFNLGDNNVCDGDVKNFEIRKVPIEYQPTRYMYGVMGSEGSSGNNASLYNMCISTVCNDEDRMYNQGYNCEVESKCALYKKSLDEWLKDNYKDDKNDAFNSFKSLIESVPVFMISTDYVVPPEYVAFKQSLSDDNDFVTEGAGEYINAISFKYDEKDVRRRLGTCTPRTTSGDDVCQGGDDDIKPESFTKENYTIDDKKFLVAKSLKSEWDDFAKKHPEFAEFYLLCWLADLPQVRKEEEVMNVFDLSVCRNDNEYVAYKKDLDASSFNVGLAKNLEPEHKTVYVKDKSSNERFVKGLFGICYTKEFSIAKTMRQSSVWVPAILGLIVLMVLGSHVAKSRTTTTESSQSV